MAGFILLEVDEFEPEGQRPQWADSLEVLSIEDTYRHQDNLMLVSVTARNKL